MAGLRCPGSATIATTSAPPRTTASWARAGPAPRSSASRINTVTGRLRMVPPGSSSTRGTCCEESKSVGQKKWGASSITSRLSASEKIVQYATELPPASGQRVLHPGGRLGMNRPLDQSRRLEIRQSRGQGRGADVAEPAPQLVEPDRSMVGDQAEQPERIAPPDQLRHRSGRTEAVGRCET